MIVVEKVPNTVRFLKLNDWCVVPEKNRVDKPYQDNDESGLRWVKKERVKGLCRPYILGNTFGWSIKSPIDINIEPVKDVQVACSAEELEEIGNITSIDFWVKRGSVYIGVSPDGWFRFYQSKINNRWQNLIIPNGEGTFEWRLGWGMEIPDDYVIMIAPLFDSIKHIKVEVGILESETLNKLNSSGLGMSVAFKPLKKGIIKRGQPIANLFIFPKSALKLKVETLDRK